MPSTAWVSALTTNSLLIDRVLARIPVTRSTVVAAIGVGLLLVPLTLALMAGVTLRDMLLTYRALFVYPLVVVYVLVVLAALERTRADVACGLRSVMLIDDDTFLDLVRRGCRISPVGELSALGAGLLLSLVLNLVVDPFRPNASAIERYAFFSRIVMLSLDIWFVYVVFAMTRLTNTLLRQPLDVDIFDLTPFEPIGRQTVWLCLTFVGSMMLGLLTLDALNWSLWQEYALFCATLIVMIVVVFYINTRNVHNVVAAKKRARLNSAGSYLASASIRLEELIARQEDTHVVATEINALAAVKQELKQTRTWPYNTEMLRALFISIVTPLLVGLARVAVVLLGN